MSIESIELSAKKNKTHVPFKKICVFFCNCSSKKILSIFFDASLINRLKKKWISSSLIMEMLQVSTTSADGT
jgi:hypothetical protein